MDIEKRLRRNRVLEKLERQARRELKQDQGDCRPVKNDCDHVEGNSLPLSSQRPHSAPPGLHAGVDLEGRTFIPGPRSKFSTSSLVETLKGKFGVHLLAAGMNSSGPGSVIVKQPTEE
jgi:hypothetical protein